MTETHLIYDYDSNGVNLVKTTDQAGRETNYTWYAATGLPNTQTDPFGNVVTYTYNTADLLSTVVPSTGISTTIASSFIVTGGPTNARYYVDKTGNDGSQTKVWYDRLGRELRTETRKFGGALVKVDKQYNVKGELSQYSEPTTGTPSSWNVVGHDTYGRVNSLDPIFGATTTYSEPFGNPTATRTVNGRNYKTTINAAGQVISTEDPGGTITNSYWPNGLLKSTLAPGSITTSMTYDKNGNRLTMTDPSAGNIANTWYGTGQPKTTANADGQTTTYSYTADAKVQLQDYSSPEGSASYTYYTNGLVNTITSPGGNLNATRSYTYELGKVKTITETFDGLSNVVTFEYDSKGRLFKKYFNGATEYEQYDYDANSGYLYRVQFTAAGTTSTVWQITTMDQYQRITQATIGTTGSTWSYDSGSNLLSGISATGVQGYSYTFDAITGNLGTRTNSLRTKTETFGYDAVNLDRLSLVTGPVNQSVGYTSNKNGNIETKSDAGTYVYDATQPYAVDQITGGLNISNDQQDIQYYSFEKVKKITEGTKTADFDYNADRQRIRMVLKTSGTVTKTRYYFGGSCEREVVAGVTTQYIWVGGDAYTAVAVAKKVGTGAWTVYNIFRDHLGTITHLKSSTTDEYSFDAWGRRRDKDDWTYTLTSEPALFADRGFTAHEYLEDFKLYNMNGRLYDPIVGRFLSADPKIAFPDFTQAYNRYSYCLNNPLKFNDPNGEFPWLYFAAQMLGNYLFGVADNTINKKMPMNQAVTQFNFNMNYSPSSNRFFTPGVDAQMTAWNMETGQSPVYTTRGWWKQVNAYAGGYDDLAYKGTTWKYVPANGGGANFDNSNLALDIGGGIYGGLRTSVTPGDQWLGNNGKYYNKSWGGNQYTGSRSGAFAASNTYKWAGRATVGATAIIGGIQVYNGYQMDGGQFGFNAQLATASAAGSIIGGWAGAKAGAYGFGIVGGMIGGPPGAVIGAVCGGFVGGLGGSYIGGNVGESSVNYYYGR